jgi:hypothetical protein
VGQTEFPDIITDITEGNKNQHHAIINLCDTLRKIPSTIQRVIKEGLVQKLIKYIE